MQLPTLTIGKLHAKLPLVQGGMAIRLSLSKLAGAVAREGGIGLIAATGLSMDELRREIRAARELAPQGIIGINIMVAASSFAEAVKTAIEEKIDLVVAGAGFSRDVFAWCKESATEFVPIVSSVKLARIAERLGASAAMKAAYIRAVKPEDIVTIQSTVGLPAQAIRTPFSEAICDDTVPRPTVCTNCLKHCTRRFCLSRALIRAQQGDGETGLIFAGSNMLRISSILPVKEIVQRMVAEAQFVRSYLPWRELLPQMPHRMGCLRRMAKRQIGVQRVALGWESTRNALAETRAQLTEKHAEICEKRRKLMAKRAAVWKRVRTQIKTWKRAVVASEKSLGTVG